MIHESTLPDIIERCKEALKKYYGPRFHGLILYGSFVRNQADELSDIDLLVLLNAPFDYFSELRQIIDVLYPVQLDSERLISAKPVYLEEFEHGSIQLYRNVKREGMLV